MLFFFFWKNSIAILPASGSGRQGISILFVTSKAKDMGNLRAIESFYKIKMPEMPVGSFLRSLFILLFILKKLLTKKILKFL